MMSKEGKMMNEKEKWEMERNFYEPRGKLMNEEEKCRMEGKLLLLFFFLEYI